MSASRASSASQQRLLLNHISTPHVTLASAVATSCALPGVMKPRKLQAKNSLGTIEDFEVDGVEWIDGSVQADIPFQVRCKDSTLSMLNLRRLYRQSRKEDFRLLSHISLSSPIAANFDAI